MCPAADERALVQCYCHCLYVLNIITCWKFGSPNKQMHLLYSFSSWMFWSRQKNSNYKVKLTQEILLAGKQRKWYLMRHSKKRSEGNFILCQIQDKGGWITHGRFSLNCHNGKSEKIHINEHFSVCCNPWTPHTEAYYRVLSTVPVPVLQPSLDKCTSDHLHLITRSGSSSPKTPRQPPSQHMVHWSLMHAQAWESGFVHPQVLAETQSIRLKPLTLLPAFPETSLTYKI